MLDPRYWMGVRILYLVFWYLVFSIKLYHSGEYYTRFWGGCKGDSSRGPGLVASDPNWWFVDRWYPRIHTN